jgi:hypothetical protein|tara:strand:- start:656 stop:877 length:222 start_codon:yes stop_codon:yes gene_type:complete
MTVTFWIGKEYLEQLNKNIDNPLAAEDLWEHTVEYTDVVVMEGQIQVTISYDKYIQLTDNELLVPWSGLDPNN